MSASEDAFVRDCWSNVWKRPKDYLTRRAGTRTALRINLGALVTLPLEMRQLVFNDLSAPDLSRCARASRSLRNEVMQYCQSTTSAVFRKLMPHVHCSVRSMSETELERYVQRAKHLGLLLKMSTALLRKHDRLECLRCLLQCFLCLPSVQSELANGPVAACNLHRSQPTRPEVSTLANAKLSGLQCPLPNACIRLFMFGHLLRAFVAGWSHGDLVQVFNELCRAALGVPFVPSIISPLFEDHPPGSDSVDEMRVRIFLRRVFFDPHEEKAQLVWLDQLLTDSSAPSYTQDARVLFLLFGPCHAPIAQGGAHVLWKDVSRETAVGRAQMLRSFARLGTVLELLEQHRPPPTLVGSSVNSAAADQFAILVWHMLNIPSNWLLGNMAAVFILAGPRVLKRCISQLAKDNCLRELGELVAGLSVRLALPRMHLSNTITFVEEQLARFCSAYHVGLHAEGHDALEVAHPEVAVHRCGRVALVHQEIAETFRIAIEQLMQEPQPVSQGLSPLPGDAPPEPTAAVVLRAHAALLVMLLAARHNSCL